MPKPAHQESPVHTASKVSGNSHVDPATARGDNKRMTFKQLHEDHRAHRYVAYVPPKPVHEEHPLVTDEDMPVLLTISTFIEGHEEFLEERKQLAELRAKLLPRIAALEDQIASLGSLHGP